MSVGGVRLVLVRDRDDDPAACQAQRLGPHDLAATLAVGDFGTGYSSLEFSIVQSVIELEHALDMRVVAELITTAVATS